MGEIVDCNNFQDARKFLANGGQKGRQRGILREGVYAINIALFNVITEDRVFTLEYTNAKSLEEWQQQLRHVNGFSPVVISGKTDEIGIVTVHEGPTLPPGELIAPAVGTDKDQPNFHNNYQDIEAFLRAGGRRGVQYTPLIDGTYFINRWFATIEMIPKSVVPIGYVGVVVSFYGKKGADTSGKEFRHGERVREGEKGVWETALGPGKIRLQHLRRRDRRGAHHELRAALDHRPLGEPPLRRFAEVDRADHRRRLRADAAALAGGAYRLREGPLGHSALRRREAADHADARPDAERLFPRRGPQEEHVGVDPRAATRSRSRRGTSCGRGSRHFDIQCVDVLIGRPESKQGDTKIENLLEQLRQRQFAVEQVETYQKQQEAAVRQKSLNEAQAQAQLQAELTKSQVQIRISENTGDAELARARKVAETTVVQAEAAAKQARLQGEGEAGRLLVVAEAQAKQAALIGEGEGKKAALIGEGEGKRIAAIGQAEAQVLQLKIDSYRDPRLYAVSIVADQLRQSQQPLVPSQLINFGGNGENGQTSMFGALLSLLTTEKFGIDVQPKNGRGGGTGRAAAARRTRPCPRRA